MSWPFPFELTTNQSYNNTINSLQNQLFLHSLAQNPFFKTYGSQIFNFPTQCALFSSPLNQSQNNTFRSYDAGSNSNNLASCFQTTVIQLKKEENLKNRVDQINLDSNKIQTFQQLGYRFRRQGAIKKQRNLISHNSSLRNDTKNIPKNYGKAMLSFIQKNNRQVKQILVQHQVDYLQFMIFVKSFKSKINTMHDLRQMWGQNEKNDKFKKCIRILSYHFMRKKCLPYIFNSRIKNFHTHIKYRKKIMQGLENPQNFTKIKEF